MRFSNYLLLLVDVDLLSRTVAIFFSLITCKYIYTQSASIWTCRQNHLMRVSKPFSHHVEVFQIVMVSITSFLYHDI